MKAYSTSMGKPRVDEATDTIHDVSLISLGNADGHFDKKGRQEVVDAVTLEQVYKYCSKIGTIKLKADHGGGVFTIVGWVDNFAMRPDKVTGDAHLYDTEEDRHKLYSIASQNPDHMAISLEFTGTDKPSGEKSLSRCDEVVAACFVTEGAANKSLFSAIKPEDEPEKTETETNKMEPENKPTDQASVEDRLNELAKRFEDYAKKFDDQFPAKEPDGDETPAKTPPEAPATDPATAPAGSDPKKTYSEDDLKKTAEFAAAAAVKKMAATIGTTQLGRPGNGGEPAKEKTFNELVEAERANHNGDKSLAMAHLLSKLGTDETIKKAYMATRLVKTS